ncbi:M48 family metallopeptidase [Ramlibacter tataouinensis]|uniref:M48 family metallopeptidase n=1 Tax=Ramlibacter tataouinensis TaxID=94132 RepID=UPI0022F3AC41|nr:M48 family metallopeptidase [Ramlibacter tataouinensis]WBY02193.1 M48 family metallopeptidase [Ramlibacter tataouinensis]
MSGSDPVRGRRGFLRSACRHCAALGLGGAGLAALAQAPADLKLPAGRLARPALDTDEGGLWALMDREETRLRRSPFVLRDKALSGYLEQLVCRLGGEHCRDVRVHVVRTPVFNASMAPNGMMQVWTGLLLRVENEAQLAAVLGHEIGHYLERHTLERLRDAKDRAAAGQMLGVFGLAGAVAGMAVIASAFAFSRDQERRADAIGMQLMQRAGYDGREAARVWDNLLGELKVTGGEDVGRRSVMLATHPPAADRRDALLRLAGSGEGRTGSDEFEQVVAPHRLAWLQEEIRRGQFEESLVLLGRMLAIRPGDPQALFARGEVHRQRDGEGDLERATQDLRAATAAERAPAEAFRSLGLVLRRRADPAGAATAFEHYLAQAPDAPDAALIRQYLNEVKP